MKANSAAIPQACAHTHTCTYMGHHKIDSTRPVIMILYFRVPVPSVLAVLITGGWGSSACTNISLSIVHLSSIVTKSYCSQGLNLLAWTMPVDLLWCLWRPSVLRSYKLHFCQVMIQCEQF